MNIYEYLFAALLIVIMILASSFMIATISEPQARASEREQLKITAEKIMNQILFDPGFPYDWGSNYNISIQNLSTFGLAKYNETTRGAYVLDSDKIFRLSNETNTDKSQRTIIRKLLNLGEEYGLALEFSTPLHISATSKNNSNAYEVFVTSEFAELPAYGAEIVARMYYVDNGQIIESNQISTSTDASGGCLVDFGGSPIQNKTLILSVTYSNLHVTKVNAPREVAILGDRIYSEENLDMPVRQVLAINENGKFALKSVNSTLNPPESEWYQLLYNEPSAACTLVTSSSELLCGSRNISNATYTSNSVDFRGLINPVSYTIERVVTIDGYTCTIRLYMWRATY